MYLHCVYFFFLAVGGMGWREGGGGRGLAGIGWFVLFTLDFDDGCAYVLDLALAEVKDVFRWIELGSFPDHGAFYCWCKPVGGRRSRGAALQTFIGRLGTERVE